MDKLLIDDGETALFGALSTVLGVRELESAPLETADVTWYGPGGAESHALERKAYSDLEASILDDRLLDECQRMRDQFDWTWLVVEDKQPEWRNYHKGLPEALVSASLLNLMYWGGVMVIRTKNIQGTAATVAWLWKHRAEEPATRLRRPDHVLMQRNPLAASYMTIPLIGEQTALLLAKRFSTWNDLLVASDHAIMEVPGVGVQRLAEIRKRLTGPVVAPAVRSVRGRAGAKGRKSHKKG